MSCSYPFKGFETGYLTENGKKEFIICPGVNGDVLSLDSAFKRGFKVSPSAPLTVINGRTFLCDPIPIPCGNCVSCRMSRAKEWKVRCCLESLDFPVEDVNFLTLTYDKRHVPERYGQLALNPKDLKKFFDRLRHPSHGVTVSYRYFACGEYGDHFTRRPHYHVLLFGMLDDLVPVGFKQFRSDNVKRAWPYGNHLIEPAEAGNIAYVCGYVEKKQADPLWNDYPVKPFIRMSTKPGLGFSYLRKLKPGIPSRKVYGNFGNVNHAPVPRAFLKKLENEPWFAQYKDDSISIGRNSLTLNLSAAHTLDQSKLGELMERAALLRLEKKRKTTL